MGRVPVEWSVDAKYRRKAAVRVFKCSPGDTPMALPIDFTSEVGHAFDAKFAYPMFVADRVGVQNCGGSSDDG